MANELTKVLSPLTVVELGFEVSTAHIGWFIAGLGGDVTLIDPSIERRLDAARAAFEQAEVDDPTLLALGLLALLADKRLLTNGDSPQAQQQLAKANIILVPASTGGKAESQRCAELHAQFSNALIVSVTPFGLSGERSSWTANDFLIYHAGGDAYFLPPGPGSASRAPVVAGDHSPGRMAGWSMLAAILAYARKVRLTGKGQVLEISQQEALLDLSRVEISRAANNGAIESRLTKAYETGGIMFASDSPVVLMPLEDHQWAKLWEILGDPDWSQSPDYATREGRREHAPEVQARLQAWVAQHTSADIYRLAQDAGVPVGIVRRASDVITSPQANSRGLFEKKGINGLTVVAPGLPFLLRGPARSVKAIK